MKKLRRTKHISADTLERDAGTSYLDEASKSGNFAGTMLHEYGHTNEGTAEQARLDSFLAEDEMLFATAEDKVLGSQYGISAEDIKSITEKLNSGEKLTAEEQEKITTYRSEMSATMAEHYLGNERVVRKLVLENEPLVERMLGRLESFKKTLAGEGEKYSAAEKARIDKALKLYLKAAEAAGNRDLVKRILALREEDEDDAILTDESYTDENTENQPSNDHKTENMKVSEGKVRYSRKIEPNMTDAERYEVLKKRSINNIPLVTELSDSVIEKIPEISSWDDISKYLGKDKRNLIQKLTREFGIFDKKYFNEDIELSFEFSGNNFRESYNKQGHNYTEFAKMFSAFDAVIESAVGIEIHNREDYKPDPTLENVFVLMSAYQDGDSIVPVKLEVKQFKDKQNTLYVAISLEKVKKTEVLKQGNTENGVTQNSRSVNISIAKIFEKINPSDKSFIKYIPEGFLNEAQKEAKRQSLDAERKAGETKYSRKPNQDRSTLTKGEAQKQRANYESDKVYTKTEIAKMVESLNDLSSIPKRFRTDIVNDIWTAFNSRYSPDQRERHSSILADKIFARVMQESGDAFDNTSQEDIYAMEREIHSALKKIAREGGAPSIMLKIFFKKKSAEGTTPLPKIFVKFYALPAEPKSSIFSLTVA